MCGCMVLKGLCTINQYNRPRQVVKRSIFNAIIRHVKSLKQNLSRSLPR
nr:MAG TPA: hypothetical protein [Caudoviricetes sp.]